MSIPIFTTIPNSAAALTFAEDFDNYLAELNPWTQAVNTLGAAIQLNVSSTSVTSVAVGSGSKSLTVGTGLGFTVGMAVYIANTAAPATNRMVGIVTAYTTGTGAMTVAVNSFTGSGTHTAWTVGPSAEVDPATYVTLNGTQTLTGKTLDACIFINGHTEEMVSANTTAAYTINLANGGIQNLTLTNNCTYTMPTPAAGKSFLLIQRQDGVGSRTATFTGVLWPNATAPTLTTLANKKDMFAFVADGSYWYGRTVGLTYS